jgi:DnaJ-class molecular chaperone
MPAKKKPAPRKTKKTGEKLARAAKELTQAAKEAFTLNMARALIAPLVPKWRKAPKGAKCSACGAGDLDVAQSMAGGPFSGTVKCPSCGHTESLATHIGKTCFKVEPLTNPARKDVKTAWEKLLDSPFED